MEKVNLVIITYLLISSEKLHDSVLILKWLRRFLLNAKAETFEHPSTLLFGARKSDHIRIGIESNIGR